MTKQLLNSNKDIEAKRAFIREIMDTYDVPIDLVRYETMTDSGDHGGMVDDME